MTRARQLLIPALLAGDARLENLAPEIAGELLEELGPLIGRLAARATVQSSAPSSPPAQERLLTPQEVAERLGLDVTWIYRHADKLGVQRLSRKVMRFTAAGVP